VRRIVYPTAQNNVVVVSGEKARMAFFASKQLNFSQAFLLFQGAVR
jgi:hypothetical protein